MKRLPNYAGFSLIELLIVISIMLTFLGLTLVNYSRGNSDFTLDKAAKQFNDVLSVAKQRANNGDTANCGADAASMASSRPTFEGYTVDANGSAFSLQVNCSSGDATLQTYQFPSGVCFDAAANVQFEEFNEGSSGAIFIIRSDSLTTNPCVRIRVNTLGVIDVSQRTACP